MHILKTFIQIWPPRDFFSAVGLSNHDTFDLLMAFLEGNGA